MCNCSHLRNRPCLLALQSAASKLLHHLPPACLKHDRMQAIVAGLPFARATSFHLHRHASELIGPPCLAVSLVALGCLIELLPNEFSEARCWYCVNCSQREPSIKQEAVWGWVDHVGRVEMRYWGKYNNHQLFCRNLALLQRHTVTTLSGAYQSSFYGDEQTKGQPFLYKYVQVDCVNF